MAADLLAGLAGPALFLAAGAGLQAIAPSPLARPWLARLGLALLLGTSWCTLVVWMASLLAGVPVGAGSFAGAAALAIAAGGAAVARRRDAGGWRPAAGRPARRGRWLAATVAALVALVALALVADAAVDPVADFDGRMVWGTLARYVQADASVLPEALTDPAAYVIHPRYPLVMPLAQVGSAALAGTEVESRAVRPLYALLFAAFLAALWPALARAGGRRGAALAVALLGLAPALLWDREVGPYGTYSDVPLAALLGAGATLLLDPRCRREPWRGWFAGLLLAAAAGTKNEGLLLAPLVLATAWWTAPSGRRAAARRALVVLALGLTLVVGWRSQVPNRNDEAYFESFSPVEVIEGLMDRGGWMAAEMARQTLDPRRWGYALWVLPLVVLAGHRGLRSRVARGAAIWITGELAMVAGAYAAVGEPAAVLAVTWTRFLVQMLAPLALITAATTRTALAAARLRR